MRSISIGAALSVLCPWAEGLRMPSLVLPVSNRQSSRGELTKARTIINAIQDKNSRFSINEKKVHLKDDFGSISTSSESNHSRRNVLLQSLGVFGLVSTTVLTQQSYPAHAGAAPTKEELGRVKTGYDGIKYLLDNFEQETTVCRENGGECKRNADAVRKYLGLRSTKDPLFQIEKVFEKVKYMDDIDADKVEDFFEATEDWNAAVNMSNSMAFISQFGEYNPGGGKDEVLKYLEESKKQVVLAERALRKIMEVLQV